MSELLDYYRVNASEAYGEYGFLGTGGGAVRLDKTREPNVEPEPMKTPAQRRRVRKSDPLDLGDIDLSELERWLSGDLDYEPELEPEQEPFYKMPTTVELDKVTFRDVILGAHGGQDVRQKEPENGFVSFLRRHYAEQRQGILNVINSATNG